MALPKVKTRKPLLGCWLSELIQASRFVTLNENETASDLLGDYVEYVKDLCTAGDYRFHPMVQWNSECVTTTGTRYAVLLYRAGTPSHIYGFLEDLCKRDGRQIAAFRDNLFADGTGFTCPPSECVVIQRAWRRK